MLRALTCAACLAISASGAWGAELWTKLESYSVDRFEISLPSEPGWSLRSGDHWFNVSRSIRTKDGALFVWVGFEVNSYPENRYDWLPAELAREIRDFQAITLLKEGAQSESPLAFLKYGEEPYAGRIGYRLTWAHRVHIDSLGRDVPEYQELHVFIPDDHAVDFRGMSVYFGVDCIADCATEFPTADLLRPILQTVRIKPYD